MTKRRFSPQSRLKSNLPHARAKLANTTITAE
jgi:hypothetical protein